MSSRNESASWVNESSWRRCTRTVTSPISTMKMGITGNVNTSVIAETGSCIQVTTMSSGMAMTVMSNCGKNLPK